MDSFREGYEAAVDDVEKAMKLSERTFIAGDSLISINAPEIWTVELKKLYNERFYPITDNDPHHNSGG